MEAKSICSLPMSIHVSVEFPSADTLVTTQITRNILGAISWQYDLRQLVRGDDLLGSGMVNPIRPAEMTFQMPGQFCICGKRFMT